MILSRAPLRVSFFGGGTDQPEWFERYGGAVLSTTIAKYVYVKIRHLPSVFPFKHRVVWRKNEQALELEDIQHPVVRAVLEKYYPHERFEIIYFSDVPALSGLGSSSAFTVALINGLAKLHNRTPTPYELYTLAIEIERKILKECGGWQDQIAAAQGGFNHITFARCTKQPVKIKPIEITPDTLRFFESHMMLCFTGLQREASAMEAAKLQRFIVNEKALNEMSAMAGSGVRFVQRGDMRSFGSFLYQSWCLKKTLTANMSTPKIDEALAKAMDIGAYGGKILGAGAGGFLLIMAPPTKHVEIKTALGLKNFVTFKIAPQGAQASDIGWK